MLKDNCVKSSKINDLLQRKESNVSKLVIAHIAYSSRTHLNRASFTRWPLIIYYVLLFSGSVLNSVVSYVILQSDKGRRNIFSSLAAIAWDRRRIVHVLRPFLSSSLLTLSCLDLVSGLHNVHRRITASRAPLV